VARCTEVPDVMWMQHQTGYSLDRMRRPLVATVATGRDFGFASRRIRPIRTSPGWCRPWPIKTARRATAHGGDAHAGRRRHWQTLRQGCRSTTLRPCLPAWPRCRATGSRWSWARHRRAMGRRGGGEHWQLVNGICRDLRRAIHLTAWTAEVYWSGLVPASEFVIHAAPSDTNSEAKGH